jgi:fumarate hydratase class II
VAGVAATPRAAELVERGLMLTTALAPVIGYDKAAEIAKKAAATGRTIREVAREETNLSAEQLEEILNAEQMTEPGLHGGGGG